MWRVAAFAVAAAIGAFAAAVVHAEPRVVLISLDGATPHLVDSFMRDGAIPKHRGLGLLARHGVVAERNITVNPSLTAPGHIAIATGSIASRNDIPANTFHLVASPFGSNISGFSAPIGGYSHHDPEEGHLHSPTAEPLWLALRAAGKRVATATFPGGDGLDIRIPGLSGSPIIQSAAKRTVDYTVPFGAFGGIGAIGFSLGTTDFVPANPTTVAQLTAAGRVFYGEVKEKTTPLESFTVGGAAFRIKVAALDTTDDKTVNYDTLVFFNETQGVQPGPFQRPATGPAYVRASAKKSALFYLEGSSTRAGTAYYVSRLLPDLSEVRLARYAANFIPRNAAVLGDVDDINDNVGFWAPQPDFRIPERLSPGFGPFPDLELEAIYLDQVRLFTDYQTRIALRAIERNPRADLVMIYFEQPDGSGHQFLLIDPRQPTDPTKPESIGAGQDPAKKARYWGYLRNAYRVANDAVQRVIDAVGTDRHGRPKSNVIVVSDHGFAPFHTAVNMGAYLAAKGFDPAKVRAITSGPAANLYINLQGREPNGTVSRAEYLALQQALVKALRELTDTNPNYVLKRRTTPVFDQVVARRTPKDVNDPSFGLATSRLIGQDSGDVFAVLAVGYNFDGTQSPVVRRLGDDPTPPVPVLSVPNFYGAHGYDPQLSEMSAIFFAAGPDVCRGELERVRNIDVAPTILRLLDVAPAQTVQGRAIDLCPRRGHGRHDHDRSGDDRD